MVGQGVPMVGLWHQMAVIQYLTDILQKVEGMVQEQYGEAVMFMLLQQWVVVVVGGQGQLSQVHHLHKPITHKLYIRRDMQEVIVLVEKI